MGRNTYIITAIILTLFALALVDGCRQSPQVLRDPSDALLENPYKLPESHPDNSNPLKSLFFQEPFRDLDGEMVQLSGLNGTVLVIVMFPSFFTDDGKRSLYGLEVLQKEHSGQFRTVFIPVEGADLIRPSIVKNPEGMLFLFRAANPDNLSLVDKYSDLFWEAELISTDFPLDPPEKHHTSPFFWVVDSAGVIREKLIDYSDARGVKIAELEEVLHVLLELPEQVEPDDSQSSVSNGGNEIAAEPVEESQE